MKKNNLVQRLTIAAAFIVFALFTTACGSDCDGLCNDGLDVYDRATDIDCDESDWTEAIESAVFIFGDYDSVAECTAFCDEFFLDFAKDTAREIIDQAKSDLDGLDC
jgi:hypothetical protein